MLASLRNSPQYTDLEIPNPGLRRYAASAHMTTLRPKGLGMRLHRATVVQATMRIGMNAAALAFAGACGPALNRAAERQRRLGLLLANRQTGGSQGEHAFFEQLRTHGWVEGETIAVERRDAAGHYERLPDLAAELARQRVDLVAVWGGTAAIRAAQQATASIPIVFAVAGDPVGEGLVARLANPGANVTGTSVVLGQVVGIKKIELLKQTLPALQRVAYLIDGDNPSFVRSSAASREAAQALGMQFMELDFRAPDQLEPVFAAARRFGAEALSVGADGFLGAQLPDVIQMAARERLPAIFSDRGAVEIGGLMSYGPSFLESYRHAADLADKILRGVKPADLPVEQPSVFELVVNVQTAQALGLRVPSAVAAQVTEWL